MITPNKKYRVKGNSKYFKEKYGTSNPIIQIEDNWKELTGGSWSMANGNPACMLYAMRAGTEQLEGTGLIDDDKVFYGKIGVLGELVHENELEAIKE